MAEPKNSELKQDLASLGVVVNSLKSELGNIANGVKTVAQNVVDTVSPPPPPSGGSFDTKTLLMIGGALLLVALIFFRRKLKL